MSVQLNHTIVMCRDKEGSAKYLTDVLGLAPARPYGPFMVVELSNGVSMDFHTTWQPEQPIDPQHYAFLISESEFDEIFARIDGFQEYWADPMGTQAGVINHNDGGRGVYFSDPNGHLLEILTRPYGSGG